MLIRVVCYGIHAGFGKPCLWQGNGQKCQRVKLVPTLLIADELLIMSTAATGLQQQLNAWQDFCKRHRERKAI